MDVVLHMERGELGLTLGYVIVSVVLCVAAFLAGLQLVRAALA